MFQIKRQKAPSKCSYGDNVPQTFAVEQSSLSAFARPSHISTDHAILLSRYYGEIFGLLKSLKDLPLEGGIRIIVTESDTNIQVDITAYSAEAEAYCNKVEEIIGQVLANARKLGIPFKFQYDFQQTVNFKVQKSHSAVSR